MTDVIDKIRQERDLPFNTSTNSTTTIIFCVTQEEYERWRREALLPDQTITIGEAP